jgi:hypothetical protein
MKQFILFLLISASTCAVAPLHAQTQEELMAKAMAANVVGKEHDILKAMEGEWEETFYYQMAPDQPAMTVVSKAKVKMILGGRFAQVKGQATMMGETSERLSILGHDNRRGVYTIDGFDTYGTYAIHAEGKYIEATKSIILEGVENDPLMPHPMKFRMVFRFPDANTMESEIWFLTGMNGEEVENKAVWSTAKRVVEKDKKGKKGKKGKKK